MLCLVSDESLFNGKNPGALSTRTAALDCGFGRKADIITMRLERKDPCCSSDIIDAEVYEEKCLSIPK